MTNTVGQRYTAGFEIYRKYYGSVITRTRYGYGFRGYGYGAGKANLRVTHTKAYQWVFLISCLVLCSTPISIFFLNVMIHVFGILYLILLIIFMSNLLNCSPMLAVRWCKHVEDFSRDISCVEIEFCFCLLTTLF